MITKISDWIYEYFLETLVVCGVSCTISVIVITVVVITYLINKT